MPPSMFCHNYRRNGQKKSTKCMLNIGWYCIRKGKLFSWDMKIQKKNPTFIGFFFILVTPTRIELVSPPWKGDVLTSWPRGLMVAVVGFEPTTCRVWTGRSGQLSYTATESHQTYQAWSIWQERLTILSYLGTFVNYFFKKNLTVLAVWIFKPQKWVEATHFRKQKIQNHSSALWEQQLQEPHSLLWGQPIHFTPRRLERIT